MPSTAQILADRQNAESSTGPVTAEGRARVSQKATEAHSQPLGLALCAEKTEAHSRPLGLASCAGKTEAHSQPLGLASCAGKTEAHSQPLGLALCARKKELSLFSVASFVRPEERGIFAEFESGYLAELAPDSPLEQTLAREIIHAAWRLRRCAGLEVNPPGDLDGEDLDRLQASIDRARATAQRTFHRSLKELRRLQAGHLHPAVLMVEQAKAMDALLKKDLEERQRQLTESAQAARGPLCAAEKSAHAVRGPLCAAEKSAQAARGPLCAAEKSAQAIPEPTYAIQQENNSAKQTQSEPARTAPIPRCSPCPCKSGQKYKRCCGKNAPPVLTTRPA